MVTYICPISIPFTQIIIQTFALFIQIAKYILNNSELRDLENTNTKNGLNHAADKKMSPFLINMYINTK